MIFSHSNNNFYLINIYSSRNSLSNRNTIITFLNTAKNKTESFTTDSDQKDAKDNLSLLSNQKGSVIEGQFIDKVENDSSTLLTPVSSPKIENENVEEKDVPKKDNDTTPSSGNDTSESRSFNKPNLEDSSSTNNSDLALQDINYKLDSLLLKYNSKSSNNDQNETQDLNSNILNDKLVLPKEVESFIILSEKFNLDFISYSKDTQQIADNIFKFYILKENTYIVPDNILSHIKSPNNRLILIKLLEHLPYKIQIWNQIYKFYFKSIFLLINKLKPLSISHLRCINNRLLTNDSLIPTPAFNMTFNIDSSVSKILYGFANGLHDMTFFLSSKFSKIDISYSFNLDNSLNHSINIVWYFKDENGLERRISKSFQSRDLSYETSIITDNWNFIDSESIYYSNTYQNIFKDLFNIDHSDIQFESLQASSHTKQVITTSQNNKIAYSEGVVSRLTLNGPVSFDHSNIYLLNSIVSMLNIDNINIDINNNENDIILKDLSLYLSGIIKHYVNSNIKPSSLKLSSIQSKFTISKKDGFITDVELHNAYRNFIRSGDLYPSAPIHFDFYFSKDTLKRFSEFAILSGLSNISINRSLKSVLPISDKSSKMNFSLYAKNRSLLFVNTYINDASFDFQRSDFYITFDELLVEMFVKTMLVTKVPDYIPLITRGQWNGTDVKSNQIVCSYLNNIFIKYSLHHDEDFILNFILNIICRNKAFLLDKSFKNKTRLVNVCPDVFERFILEEDFDSRFKTSEYCKTEVNYLDTIES